MVTNPPLPTAPPSLAERAGIANITLPAEASRWETFVSNHPDSTLYHSLYWHRVIQRAYGYSPAHAVCERNGNIRSALPAFWVKSRLTGNRLVTLPFSDYCEPLLETADDLSELVNALQRELAAGNGRHWEIHLRRADPALPALNFTPKPLAHCIHLLDLRGDLKEIQAKFHKSQILRNIKKAQKSDLRLVFGTTEAAMKTFYRLLCLTRRRHGLPPQPYQFYRAMWQILFPQKMLHVLLAMHQSQAIAGILLGCYRDTMYYLYGGSLVEYWKFRPNHLLLWEGIRHAHAAGFSYFDFGRSGYDNPGLIDFKQRWGAEEYPLCSYTFFQTAASKSLRKERGGKSNLLHKIIRKTPVPLLRIGGSLLYKHLG